MITISTIRKMVRGPSSLVLSQVKVGRSLLKIVLLPKRGRAEDVFKLTGTHSSGRTAKAKDVGCHLVGEGSWEMVIGHLMMRKSNS